MEKKLRVLFFTHDSLYSARLLTELLSIQSIELVGIVQSKAIIRRNKSLIRDGLRLLSFSGIRYAIYLIKITMFYKSLAKYLSISTLNQLIKKNTIPIIKTKNVNTLKIEQFIREHKPDICITAFFNQFVKEHILKLPPLGFINLHPSFLPKNRGVDPVFYAYLRKEEQGGVTVHFLDNTLDTGNILLQKEIPIDHSKSLLFNQWNHFDQGASLIHCVLTDFKNYLPGKLQEINAGNYDGWPDKIIVKKISIDKLTRIC